MNLRARHSSHWLLVWITEMVSSVCATLMRHGVWDWSTDGEDWRVHWGCDGRSGAAFVLAQDGNQLSASILELLVTSELGTCGLAQALVMAVVSTEYWGGEEGQLRVLGG